MAEIIPDRSSNVGLDQLPKYLEIPVYRSIFQTVEYCVLKYIYWRL